MDKPDVDLIQGISPAMAIEQKTNTRNPRSTVGTTTEVYDYLRILFARDREDLLPEVRQTGHAGFRARRFSRLCRRLPRNGAERPR